MLTPIAEATGPTNLKPSPISWTDVFELDAALARMSATLEASDALFPNPRKTDAVMSAASANSSCPAAARSNTLGIASMISLAEKPACPKKPMPWAAS